MSITSSAIYGGHVVHKRLSPRRHSFKYRVFSLCLDVDQIGELSDRLRHFSYNARNLVSIYDTDHGNGDGEPIANYIRRKLSEAGLREASRRVMLLCYPRLMGYVFNPLSVYFCYRSDNTLGATVYEVTNTFGERTSYIIPAGTMQQGILDQSCAKRMYVSPFIGPECAYGFHVEPPSQRVVVGVTVRDGSGPLLKTHFHGRYRLALSDASLRSVIMRHPAMTLKIIAAIHLEAARLWMKGIPLMRHHKAQDMASSRSISQTHQTIHVSGSL